MKHTKFLKVGVLALASLLTASYAIDKVESNVNDTVVFATDLAKKITDLQENNIFPNNKIFLNIKDDELRSNFQGSVYYSFIKESCDINIDLDKDLHFDHLTSKEMYDELSEILSLESEAENKLNTEFIIYHELAHCEFYKIKDIFHLEDNRFNDFLNDYYPYSSGSVLGGLSIYDVYHENFADVYGAINILKQHGINEQTLKFLNKKIVERESASLESIDNGEEIVHNTDLSLRELFKEDNLKKINETNNPEELKKIALEISSQGTMKSLAIYNNYEAISMSNVAGGVSNMLKAFYNIERSKNTELGDTLFDKDSFISNDTAIYRITNEVKNDYLDNYLKGMGVDINNPDAVKKVLNDELEKEKINEYIIAKVESEIYSFKGENDNYLIEDLFDYLDEVGKDLNKSNIKEIKKTANERLDSVSELVKSVNQENINNSPQMYLENIKKIRTLSIKPNNNLIIRNSA